MKIRLIVLLLALTVNGYAQPLTRIAFGSCSNEELPTEMWSHIVQQKPQLCILLGDNIYGDTHDMVSMRRQYDLQKNMPSYQALLKQCPVIGTWDDHDYGQNDGGKNFSKKHESKIEFMRFMDIPENDPIRTHEGVYSVHTYGTPGKKVKVILLDVRSFRDTTIRSTAKGKRYEPNPDGDMLGEAQWTWFENEIRNSDADVHIIGSGIQLISNHHAFEKWGNFPKSRQRMLDLLAQHKPKNPLILSGDRHIAEISRLEVEGLPKPLIDFTSSGLTHTWNVKTWKDMPVNESNPNRIGKLVIEKNFGMILIDWSGPSPIIRLEVRGENNALWDEPLVIK